MEHFTMTHKGTITLETERLILRRFELTDAEAMFRNWANDPEVSKFLTWQLHETIEVTRGVIENWVNSCEAADKYEWAIELKSLGEPIGSIAAMKPNEKVRSVDIGYCIGKAWWHNGYVAEALTAVVKFLFEEVGVNRINAIHDPQNPNSGAVMRKAGFTFEAAKRQAGFNNQGICGHCEYAILAEDYFKKLPQTKSLTLTFTQRQIAAMHAALNAWGVDAQVDMAVEELAELIVALHKHVKRTHVGDTLANVLDEIADVELMLGQMRLIFGISDNALRERIAVKTAKLENYLRRDGVEIED
jgi:ribosomal-protein-alanine N-acetyltransferase